MSQVLEVFRFECRYQLRSPLFLIVAAIWFLLAFLIMSSESVSVGGIGDALNLNASYAIVQIQYTMTILGMFPAIAFVAGAITRDYELRSAELFFASGVSPLSYLYGRFAGGTLFAVLAVVAALLGTALGSAMPWLDPERLGPFSLAPYWFSLWAVIVPNLLVLCALFFVVAALSRSLMAAYVAALGFIVCYVVVSNATDQENLRYVALLGPFGSMAFDELTRYWTVFERNFAVPAFSGTLLYNRLIWLAVAVAALLFVGTRFRFDLARGRHRRRTGRGTGVPPPALLPVAAVPAHGGPGPMLVMLFSQTRQDFRGVVKSIPFYVMLVFGILNVLGGFFLAISQIYGTEVYPRTKIMVQAGEGSFFLAVLVVLIYYSGELVHREREAGVASYLDSAPHPNGVMVLSKVAALWLVLSALFVVLIVTSIVVQAFTGYYEFELSLYLKGVFGAVGVQFYLWAVAAILVQVLSPNKFIGMVVLLLLFLGMQSLESFGYEHVLYQFGTPEMTYSDMNGYGPFAEPFATVAGYWACFSGLLLVAAHLLYPRGAGTAATNRVVQRMNPVLAAASCLLLAGFSALGGWIYYNTNVLNEYLTEDDAERARADYEKAYKTFDGRFRLEVMDIDAAIDLYPAQRRLESRGTARLKNPGSKPVPELHVTLAPELAVRELTVPGAQLLAANERLGYYRYQFSEPLAPGAELTLGWDLGWLNEGFPNARPTTRVAANGTFVNNLEIMPIPGYDPSRELDDNNVRRRYGLGPVERLPKLGDPSWLGVNQLGVAARSGFRAVFSTSEDQIAVAPGYLAREWREGGRRFFEYAMDDDIWPFVSFSSARYAVARDQWRNVDLEVYHHPEHDYNVQAMLRAAKKSLAYFTAEFSPYQYRQFRILEFPGYQRFAQSFPNTIPYSESIGFIADLRDPDNIDYVFYVTAHELAHQWWAHQVIGARMQGMTVIVETLAQYSALMVMQREYGAQRMRRFLKYELDNYLRSRGAEQIEELPLVYSENQGYIHYRKGSLVMYALQDRVGEDNVNRALRSFLEKHAFQGPPFPTALDLLAEFRAVAASGHQALITDLFERIVLFDLRVLDAAARPIEGGYEVTLKVAARKLEADGTGKESEAPLRQEFEIGIFPAADNLGDDDLPVPLLLEAVTLSAGEHELRYVVSEPPARVGIDPYVKMIDRNPADNLHSL